MVPGIDWLQSARRTLEIERAAVDAIGGRLDDSFVRAGELLLGCAGRVVVSGMGKSGHIAGKIAATLASTGTPAFFLHPAEAGHGDLGMITRGDVLLALSNSGETAELVALLPQVKRLGVPLIAITGNASSTLAQRADVVLDARVPLEACPHNLAPTASTTAALALGDALAVALLEARGFSAEDFARAHPGGTLGRQLLLLVADVMRTGTAIPRISSSASLKAGLLEMSRKGLGLTVVVNADGRIAGVFTDGDLRRALDSPLDLEHRTMAEVMTHGGHRIGANELAAQAARLMETRRITALPVVDGAGELVGALSVHDLMRAGVV
jgi:arabinose-5-phosphate isomerase